MRLELNKNEISNTDKNQSNETNFNPDDRVETIENANKNSDNEIKEYNPDERINVDSTNVKELSQTHEHHDVSKVEDINIAKERYIEDLKSKCEYPEGISKEQLANQKLEIQSPEKVAEKREEFDDNKASLRKEWEEKNGREWPKYQNDVYNKNGIKIRKAGDNYDAHHVVPLQLGGKNEASNITPIDLSKHTEIHSKDGSCTNLVNAVKGVE